MKRSTTKAAGSGGREVLALVRDLLELRNTLAAEVRGQVLVLSRALVRRNGFSSAELGIDPTARRTPIEIPPPSRSRRAKPASGAHGTVEPAG